jgi:hypothetical protein
VIDSGVVDKVFLTSCGNWTVPSVTCTAEDTITSEWVGLDGASAANPTVEQDGTLAWCFDGSATYYTWYEMYPAAQVSEGQSLQPGDNISASVLRSGKSYTLTVTDGTNTANSFTEPATCKVTTCLDESAEWIAERPAFSIGVAPLADYGTWTLSNGRVSAGGSNGFVGTSSPVEVEMVDATSTGPRLSAPSSRHLISDSPLTASG